MKFDFLTFGSATVDLLVKSKEFKLVKSNGSLAICELYGAKVEIDEFALESGGGGTNTAVGLSRLGLRSAPVVKLGKDSFSEIVLSSLKKEGVDTSWVVQKREEETDFSVILVSPEGGRTILVYRGKTRLEEEDIRLSDLQASWFHLSSLEGNTSLAEQIFQRAKSLGAKTSWNPGGRELPQAGEIKRLLPLVDVLVLNQEEMEQLLQQKMEGNSFWQEVFLLPVELVAITQGKRGAWLALPPKREKFHHSAFSGWEVVEETGAGDAFCSGLIAAIFYGRPLEEALDWGLLNGAGAVRRFGAKAGLLSQEEIRKGLQEKQSNA